MNQRQDSAESGDAGRAGADPPDTARGRDRLGPRWLVWLALAAAIVVAAVCATDDPEPLGQPGGGDPSDCYTTEADQPQQPRDTNRYVIALTADEAGAREEYARCQYLPAQNPDSADLDCYSTGDDNEWGLTGVNRYALALLEGGASAGALDKYAKCEFMPAVLGGTGDGTE